MEAMNYYNAVSRVGLVLCTAGHREVIIDEKRYTLSRGVLCFMSPIIFIVELSRSDDYAEEAIVDAVDVFYPAVKPIFDIIMQCRLRENPCIMLDDAQIGLLLRRKASIEHKRQLLTSIADPMESHLARHAMQLLQQTTLIEFIHLYYRNRNVEPRALDKREVIAFRFMYSLHHNYKTHRSVGFYADEANISTGHLTRIVKEQTGRPPSEWIAFITISNAKLLLAKTEMSIKEIAAELHFPEQFTFRKFFKLHVGVPPKEYRQKNRLLKE